MGSRRYDIPLRRFRTCQRRRHYAGAAPQGTQAAVTMRTTPKVLGYNLPGGKIMRQIPPLASCSLLVEKCVHDLASLVLRFLRPWLRVGDELSQLVPLLIGQI